MNDTAGNPQDEKSSGDILEKQSKHEALLRQALKLVTSGKGLSIGLAKEVTLALIEADLESKPILMLASGLLCALKTRGESVDEIVGAAQCLSEQQISVPVRATSALLDTCGTGGDGANLVNISTLAALTAACLGVRVAKHGNRSVSSSCGSADLLEALGYPMLSDSHRVAENVSKRGFGFLFAPNFHPALKQLAGLRRSLGLRTLFNLLGPLVNPAAVTHQIIGVYDRHLVDSLALASARLGKRRVLVVHGEGGLDELSPFGTSWVTLVEPGSLEISSWEWTPKEFGAPSVKLSALKGGDIDCNTRIAKELLAGGRPEVATAVAMNTAAALWVTESAGSLGSAYRLAYDALRSGEVGRYFERCRFEATRLS